jgi:uncharacterized protein YjeT (DUF2065 family)
MASKGVEWIDKLFVIGLILILVGIALLSLVGIMLFLSPSQYRTSNRNMSDFVMDAVLAGIILIATGAVIMVVLNRLSY